MCFFDINSGELTYYKTIDYDEPSYNSIQNWNHGNSTFMPNNIDFNELNISVFNDNDIIICGYKGTQQNSSSSMIHYKRKDTVIINLSPWQTSIDILPINVYNNFSFTPSTTSSFYYLGMVNQKYLHS